jgi:hypothetical protein
MERYRVFGRTSYPEPLAYQGTLTAAGDAAAPGAALERFGRGWVELVVIPERAIHWILGPEPGPVPSEPPEEPQATPSKDQAAASGVPTAGGEHASG